MRIGILSFAHLHAESYAHALQSNPTIDFIGMADDDQARGEHHAAIHNARLFDSYEALLAEKPDGVIVCSENVRHAPLVQMAAEAGVNILCEKPLATTLEDGQMMLDVCAKAGVLLMTAFPMRFSTPTMNIKTLVDSGQLGQIYGCNTTNQGQMPILSRAWFVDKTLAGGGSVMDHTVHLADLMRWFFGCEVTEVYAQTNAILYSEQNTDVETGGLVLLTFENGLFASIDCSWSRPLYYPTWGNVKMEIVGENGLATLDAFKQALTVYRHSAQRPAYAYWGSDADQGMVDEFVAAIEENRPPAITGYDGYKAVEIALAAYRSAESGEPVKLPL